MKCSKHGTVAGKCPECNKEYQRRWYLANKETQNARARESNRKSRNKKREFIYSYILESSCLVCGESDPATLQFDHIDPGTKVERISKMIFSTKYKIKDIEDEIQKCQILCANCHAKKTAEEFGWYKGLEHLKAGVSPHSYKV